MGHFRKGQKLRDADLNDLEDRIKSDRIRESVDVLISSSPTGTHVDMFAPDTTGTGTGSVELWAKLVNDIGDGTYHWLPTAPAGPPDFWVDGPVSSFIAVEANLNAGLPIPSRVPYTPDGSGRARFQMELCS